MNLNLNIGDIICSVDNEWPKWKYKKLKVISLHRDGQAYLELLEDIYEIKKGYIFETNIDNFKFRKSIIPEYFKL